MKLPRFLQELLLAGPLLIAVVLAMNVPDLDLAPLPEPERSWQAQVEDVRQGKEKYLVVEQQVIDDNHLKGLADLTALKSLELGRSAVTPQGIRHLHALPKLERLTLRGQPVDDDLFQAICELPHLQFVNLPDTTISDRGIAAIGKTTGLQQLRLGSSQLTDAGLGPIAALESLRFLHLINIPITDQGLLRLSGMTQLESLYLDGARVTDVGVERLLKQLPGLHFHVDQAHHDSDPRRGTHEHP